ncbi:ankyrin repeat domain-containing protein [Bizionia gelidisalsuginis]|uniref:Ankyrin repeat domain-containing protein n=1 Tax=Bizionia gelidisalsuginis TaxID=291188 RepID=A0ABY3MAG7_9FLAO|nr:ankyrin repeat domain-containing protein [Bizionia gelidisalsuginis]
MNKYINHQSKSFIIKISILISAIVFVFSFVTVTAKSIALVVNNNNIETVFNVNSFCIFIVKGDVETVVKLLVRGNISIKKWDGMTPVMYAAKYNRVEISKRFIEKGAALNTESSKGYTARVC